MPTPKKEFRFPPVLSSPEDAPKKELPASGCMFCLPALSPEEGVLSAEKRALGHASLHSNEQVTRPGGQNSGAVDVVLG